MDGKEGCPIRPMKWARFYDMIIVMGNTTKEKKKKGLTFPRIFRILGPGLVTGAADDDPSGIATYSQTGAQFGYGQLWTAVFLYPLMTAVQEACARIGAVTKKGIAQVIRENYNKKILIAAVTLILVANTVNIGADIGAMASAVRLVLPIPFVVITLLFTALMLCLEIWIPYKTYAHILKWLAVSLLVYPVIVFLVHEPWREILAATFLPHISMSFGFLFILVGVAGTTISPYMFFWQASEEVEEEIEHGLDKKLGVSKKFMRNLRIDNALGMFISEFITWCIIIATATVLHASGVTNIATASDAARALVPLVHTFPNAGFLAELIFAIGIVGLGLLAVPVLAGSAAYALSEAFSWHEGLYRKFREAHGFYGVITVATLIGLLINFVGIDPIKALIVTAVLNGVVAVPLIALIITISSNEKIMGEHKSGWLSKTLLWITFAVMLIAAVGMFLTFR
jgi:NRAMP (natural resistance-associated macrophage protein)-like metal ion transporter